MQQFSGCTPNDSAADTTSAFSFEGLSLQFHFKGPRLTVICFVAALTQQQLLRLAFHKQGEAAVSEAQRYITSHKSYTMIIMFF